MLKISFGMIVLNGEPFIRYNLQALYPHAYEILIVEGAVEKFAHAATSDGHSIDRTVEIIKAFPDPENKIKLIQCNGFWPEKDEMCNAYMKSCTGDYIWQIDVDEFYKPNDMETIIKILSTDREITRVDIKSICFLRSFNARVMGATIIYGADIFTRIFAFEPGYRYTTHRPPTLADGTGKLFQHKKCLTATELEKHGVVLYHYSYILHDYVKGKADYYSKMKWGGGHEDGLKWFRNQWTTLSNPLRVHIQNFPPSWIIPFEGEHPAVIYSMIDEIKYKPDPEIEAFLKFEYRRYQKIGETLANLILSVRSNKMSKGKAVTLCLFQLFPPINIRAVNVNLTVIKTILKILRI